MSNEFTRDELKKITNSNKEAWNNVTKNHKKVEFIEFVRKLASPDGLCISSKEQSILNTRLSVTGKRIAQIACNSGCELLSLVKLGAIDCVGFDISEEAVKYAQEISTEAKIPCKFVCIDVYDINPDDYAPFDIVYLTIGALGWFPDLNKVFVNIMELLAPGGSLFIYEIHPMLDMFKPDNECNQEELSQEPRIADSYFRKELFVNTEGGIDYVSQSKYEASTEYWAHHRMDEIIMAGINNNLQLSFFEEHADDISKSFNRLKDWDKSPPLSYALIMKKFPNI